MCSAAVLLLCASLIVTVLPSGVSALDIPASKTFIDEDADELTFADWDDNWLKIDANPLASTDTWCRTSFKKHDGTHSVYCAKTGYNTHYVNATGYQVENRNILDLPDPLSPTQEVHRYDTNMQAVMRQWVGGLEYYNTLTLTFWFYSDTGASNAKQPFSGTDVGYDFLNVVYFTGGNNSLVRHLLWTDTYEQATSKSWIQVTIPFPTNATWIGFEFLSGTVVPEGGDQPYEFQSSYGVRTNPEGTMGMREGVYVDSISLVGTEPVESVPIISYVDDLPAYQNSSSFPVSWVDNDILGITMEWIYLYYRVNGTGDWIKYTTVEKPFGAFVTSPITFEATQEGLYEFFTQGKYLGSNLTEAKRNTADESTIVDTIKPVSSILVSGDEDSGTYVGAAAFSLTASDGTSGIEKIWYRVDEGAWTAYATSVGLATTGPHTVEYYAEDKAGNKEVTKSATFTISAGEPGIVFEEHDDSYPSGGDVTVNFTVVGDGTIDKLEYSIDGGSFVELDTNATSVTLSGLEDGEHTLVVKATDSSNNNLENELKFAVGRSASDDPLSNPLVLGGLGAAALAAIGGGVWYMRRKKA